MKKTAFILLLISLTSSLNSQTVIKMKRKGGVSYIPCRVNGLDLELIFDTGASDISISSNEFSLMLKNGMLTKDDIVGKAKYVVANGDTTECVVVNLKEIQIAGLKLVNIRASVVDNLSAPLLLGQNAISKLGKIELDLDTNTLTILRGNGSYDYSVYSLNNRLEVYYDDVSIVKVEKNDNLENLSFSYVVPNKWKEQKVTNPLIFKNYQSDEYPVGTVYELRIGLQLLPLVFSTYEACEEFVNNTINSFKKIDANFKDISISRTSVSFCKAIESVSYSRDEDIEKLSVRYWIYSNDKLLSFIYTAYSPDKVKLELIESDFKEFCKTKISSLIIFNAFETEKPCDFQSLKIQNKKGIDIIIKKACNYSKIEGASDIDLLNKSSISNVNIMIGEKNIELVDFKDLNYAELKELQNGFTLSQDPSVKIISSSLVTVKDRKYINLKTKSKSGEKFILTESYVLVVNNTLVTIFSFVSDRSEEKLNSRFQIASDDLYSLLKGIEIIGEK